MKQTIMNVILALSMALLPATILATPVYACGKSVAAQQVFNGIDQDTSAPSCDDSGVNNVVSIVVNILSFIIGVTAVIVIMVSGFKYITSGGDSGKVGNAKNTLIYALIGLAVAGLAQFLVHFVINNAAAAIPKN